MTLLLKELICNNSLISGIFNSRLPILVSQLLFKTYLDKSIPSTLVFKLLILVFIAASFY